MTKNQGFYSAKEFPLIEATLITPSAQLPDDKEVEFSYLSLIQLPDETTGVFGPIAIWRESENSTHFFMYSPTFKTVPQSYQRIMRIANEGIATVNYTDDDILATNLVAKRGGSWKNLVNASRISKLWSEILINSINEITFYNNIGVFPVKKGDDANEINLLIASLILLDEDELVAISPMLIDYIQTTNIMKEGWETENSVKFVEDTKKKRESLKSVVYSILDNNEKVAAYRDECEKAGEIVYPYGNLVEDNDEGQEDSE